MIDHVGLVVSGYPRSKAFFEQALAPLGYVLLMEYGAAVGGFGRGGKPDFWIKEGNASGGIHVAISSDDRPGVDAFYAAAIAAGGTCNGTPGPRTEYHPNYYGAFVLDPDGNNIEAVCHAPAA